VISVRIGELAEQTGADALLRPVAADWSAVTPAMRRLELAAGPSLVEQCLRIGELPIGSAAITSAGVLNVPFMVHVVVRSRDEGVSATGVRTALRNGLRRLREWDLGSVVMAPLGTGAGHLDAEQAADIMVPLLLTQQAEGGPPRSITIVVENDYEREAFEAALAHPRG
jgi:O-acetyl-ADP-ribose deacetylase (regulator of RNase III)